MLGQRWFFACWFPCIIASCAAAAYLFLAVDDGIPMPRGPGGGGEGIFFLLVSFLRLLTLIAIAACLMLMPRGKAWNVKAVVMSIAMWSLIVAVVAIVFGKGATTTVHVRAFDTTGRPLPGIRMDYRWSKRLPLMRLTQGRGAAASDSNGIATFQVPMFDALYVHGDPNLLPKHDLSVFNHRWSATLQVLHTKGGKSDRNTYSATPPKASELDMSMEFDPPPPPPPPNLPAPGFR